MAKVGGTITVSEEGRGWKVLMEGPFHTVYRTLGSKAVALDFAREQKTSQEAREKAQSGLEAVYVLVIEGEEVLEELEISPIVEVVEEPVVAEPPTPIATLSESLGLEPTIIKATSEQMAEVETVKLDNSESAVEAMVDHLADLNEIEEPTVDEIDDILVTKVEFKKDTMHVYLDNSSGEPSVVWRDVKGKTGERKLTLGKSHWTYKATDECRVRFILGDSNGKVLFAQN